MSPSYTATISAQPGPQTEFLQTSADLCIYGGATGGRKTVALALEPTRHVGRVANFSAVFFRRTTPQITNPGGLWDETLNFYPRIGGTPHTGACEWRWPRGGKIKFSHLQFDATMYDWQGAQIPLICFDELTHFTAHPFFYMVSRNRSTATSSLTSVPRATRTGTAQLDRRHRGRPRREWRLLAARYVAPAGEPGRRRKTALNIASQDGTRVRIGFGQDPGRPVIVRRSFGSGRSVDSA
jgi:hypothetical protein